MTTVQEIHTMDGPTLCHLAWAWELDPRDVVGRRVFAWQRRCWGEWASDALGTLWRPHERRDQAEDAFRGLRALGWKTCVVGGDGCGEVWAERLSDGTHCSVPWDGGAATEALALLRCAVLAMATVHAA